MSAETNIEWCDSTFNPWLGCTKVSPACDHCYAERSTPSRTLGVTWGAGQPRRRTAESTWKLPLRWNANADEFMAKHGRRQRVFCASLADVFDNAVDREWRDDLATLILSTPHLDWLLLTKRIGNVGNMLPVPFDFERLYPNVWIGATITSQEEADRDIPKLLTVPAAKRFLSMEPLLGPVDLTGEYLTAKLGEYPFKSLPSKHRTRMIDLLDWVIVGGESGPGARPMHPDWARSLRDQCEAAGVPFLFKQWGEWAPGHKEYGNELPFDLRTNSSGFEWYSGDVMTCKALRVGKKAAGRLLDGREWNGVPA